MGYVGKSIRWLILIEASHDLSSENETTFTCWKL